MGMDWSRRSWESSIEIKQAAGHPDRVFIRINRMVTLEQAAAIFNIIKGDK